MYSAAFIFEPGDYDDEFHRLNALIDEAANATDGFRGTESWQNADGRIRNATYYFDTLQSLETFSRDPRHLEAKKQYRRWYKGYHIVVAEVLRSYGDVSIEHITGNERAR